MSAKRSSAKKVSKTKKIACLLRSNCPIANALEIIGDKWTLVIVRDLLFSGKKQYREFLESEEGIQTNILADRLKRLADSGIIAASRYHDHPPRFEYQLTRRGEELFPVLREIIQWSNRHIPGTNTPPEGLLGMMEGALAKKWAGQPVESK